MKPVCQFCGVSSGPGIVRDDGTWRCPICMIKQIYTEEEFYDDIVEFTPYFDLEDQE